MTSPLGASSPSEWAAVHGARTQAAAVARWATVADLTTGGGAILRDRFDSECRAGWPAQPAAIGVVGAYGGMLAAAVGFRLAATAGHWLASPGVARWSLDDDEWCDDVALDGATVLVPPGHPWAGSDDVEVVADRGERDRRTIEALVKTLTPIVDVCHRLAKVGRNGLWMSVIDAYATSIVHQRVLPITSELVDRIRSGTTVDGVPWRGRPEMLVEQADFGQICVVRRSGCCLAYVATWPDTSEADDEPHLAYEAEFPEPAGAPAYCADCSLRAIDDCIARQAWWRTYEHQHE